MEGILKFKLPEDGNNFEIAVKAMSWALASWDMDKWLRDKLEYGHEYKTGSEALDAAREQLQAILDEHGITLEDIQ